ncbi:hypothetical protein [Amycolatopsis sp. cmx-4-54]|uniref:hypothetical protein n=1 Tax=Amycolatopsis sp. cmx-4-54 TaxID=2790936 RepID=UPI00397C158A
MPLPERRGTSLLPPSLIKKQQGIVSKAQLRSSGHTRSDVRAKVDGGRWQIVLPGVVATFTGALSRQAKLCAALLYGGKDAVLSHHTAAEEWHLVPIAGGPVEITVPYTNSAISRPPLVVVHRSRTLARTAIKTNPPRTRLADTIIDLATSRATPQEATNAIVDLVGRSRVTTSELEARLDLRPPFRHRAGIRRGLELVRGGLMSALEVAYQEDVEDLHGLPRGSRQTPFEVDEKTLWEDVTYDAQGAAVTVRLDGRSTHSTPGVAFRDRRRDNAAELAGRARLVYGWRDVRDTLCAVAAEVRAILLREGWNPRGARKNVCPRCR